MLDEIFSKFRIPILILLSGAILVVGGIVYFKSGVNLPQTKVEILNDQKTEAGPDIHQDITVEIAGEIIKPGVYKLPNGSRVDDLLIISGGLTANADRIWTDKYLNKAAKLTDGQKVYIPKAGEPFGSQGKQSTSSTAKVKGSDQTVSSPILGENTGLVNINTGSTKELDSLPGIGPTYAQNIVEHRPYSTLEELVSKGAIKQNLFDKIKDKISVY